ncbi:hypothetical protein [Roseospirillum parvum]|uniref:Uncharacterized protein n=1 Tax=Roseospirillum parvum TaxID=83401 RepID=A0A1G7TLW2_9PROT|nr:hypothetical protein [Roseospirillum parvum]SDG36191.1 hypothetical protein SAMN05421742_10137 [Roseospirillum parvum]
MARACSPALTLDPATGIPRLASEIVLPEPVMRALVRGTSLVELIATPANDPFAPDLDDLDDLGDLDGTGDEGDEGDEGDVIWAWVEEDEDATGAMDPDDEDSEADTVAESLLSVMLARKLKG